MSAPGCGPIRRSQKTHIQRLRGHEITLCFQNWCSLSFLYSCASCLPILDLKCVVLRGPIWCCTCQYFKFPLQLFLLIVVGITIQSCIHSWLRCTHIFSGGSDRGRSCYSPSLEPLWLCSHASSPAVTLQGHSISTFFLVGSAYRVRICICGAHTQLVAPHTFLWENGALKLWAVACGVGAPQSCASPSGPDKVTWWSIVLSLMRRSLFNLIVVISLDFAIEVEIYWW